MQSGARAASRHVAVALLLAAALAVAWASSASAEPTIPPPSIDTWPANPNSACPTGVAPADDRLRRLCEWWQACIDLNGRDEAKWTRLYCGVRMDAKELRDCWREPQLMPTATCEAGRRRLAERCAGRPAGEIGPDGWLCDQYFLAFRAEHESRWEKAGCADLMSRSGPGGRAQADVDFCRNWGERRYRLWCNGGSTPTPRPSGIDGFCGAWRATWLARAPDEPPAADCKATAASPQEAKRCRAVNEERWQRQTCAFTYTAEPSFCRDYGRQRYADFCGPNPVSEEKPEGIEEFCRDWPSNRYAQDPAPTAPPPPPPPPPTGEPRQGAPDVFADLGAGSPFCKYPRRLTERVRAACATSGSVAHQYPISHYGLDYWGSPEETDAAASSDPATVMGFSPWEVGLSIAQTIAGLGWMALVYVIKGVLLLLEWAFEIPLIGGCKEGGEPTASCVNAMPEVSAALLDLHENVLGTPWMLAAISAAGVWGIWSGLIRKRFSQTVAGLTATVLLMTAGLAVINNPYDTVGWVARITNDASLGVLNATSRFKADNPTGSFAEAQQGLFDTLVTRPWCALQFGDVKWCSEQKGENKLAVADVWLTFEAGGMEREALYDLTRGKPVDNSGAAKTGDLLKELGCAIINVGKGCSPRTDEPPRTFVDDWRQRDRLAAVQEGLKKLVGNGEAKDKVRLQETAGVPTRFGVLILVSLSQLGAILVLGWVAIRLAAAAIVSLVLLMFAPVMLFAPAFGDAGRSSFVVYGMRTGKSLLEKFGFSIVLMVLLVISALLAGLKLGWFGDWLVQGAFWWTILIKRGALTAFAGFDIKRATESATAPGGGGGVVGALMAYGGIRQVAGEIAHVAGKPARAMQARGMVNDRARAGAVKDRAARLAGNRAQAALTNDRDIARQRAGQPSNASHHRHLNHLRATREAIERGRHAHAADADARRNALEARKRTADAARSRAEAGLTNAAAERGRLDERMHGALSGEQQERVRGLQEQRRALMEQQRHALEKRARSEGELANLSRQESYFGAERRVAEESGSDSDVLSRYDDMLEAIARRRNELGAGQARLTDELEGYERELGQNTTELRAALVDPDLVRAHDEDIARHQEALDSWVSAQREHQIASGDLAADIEFDDGRAAEVQRLREEHHDLDREFQASAEFTEYERRAWMEDRRAAIERGADPTDDPQLLAAGVDPDHYRNADPDERRMLAGLSKAAMDEDRRLFELMDADELPSDVLAREEHDALHGDRTQATHGDPQYLRDLERRRAIEEERARRDNEWRKNGPDFR